VATPCRQRVNRREDSQLVDLNSISFGEIPRGNRIQQKPLQAEEVLLLNSKLNGGIELETWHQLLLLLPSFRGVSVINIA